MPTLVLMKAFESAPNRYDIAMRLITLGKITKLRRELLNAIPANANVLDVGCGTGELLPLLAQRATKITAIDKDPEMVRTARERAAAENILDRVVINRNTALEVDRLFPDTAFHAIVLSLLLSELTNDERAWLMRQCSRMLKPDGILIIADEFQPDSIFKRAAFYALRLPIHLITYLYTQIKALTTSNIWWKMYYTIIELPLMLLSFFTGEPLTKPVKVSEVDVPGEVKLINVGISCDGFIRLVILQKENRTP